jgi:hypothetical protein
MNASSESGLWAMEISIGSLGLLAAGFWVLTGGWSFQRENCILLLMLLAGAETHKREAVGGVSAPGVMVLELSRNRFP